MKQMELTDWRRQVAEIYSRVRTTDDQRAAWHEWKDARSELFAHHPQSPNAHLDAAERGIVNYFPYDPQARHEVSLIAVEGAEEGWPIGQDGLLNLAVFARTDGLKETLGQELNVYWISGYGGGLFLPFADATSGVETYGGGRYLLDTIKGADLGTSSGRLVLDFNFAYYPSRAHSEEWVCPLAPASNRLSVRVEAGQRY